MASVYVEEVVDGPIISYNRNGEFAPHFWILENKCVAKYFNSLSSWSRHIMRLASFVCLSICSQFYSTSYKQIALQFYGFMEYGDVGGVGGILVVP